MSKEIKGEEAKDIPGAVKFDGGKAPVYRGTIAYFPRSVALVASISNFGATKYAWKGWEHVPNGFDRYSDAMVRHLLAEGQGEIYDPDSGLFTIGHTLWNSFARTELFLKTVENGGTK